VNRRALSVWCLAAAPLVNLSTRFVWPHGSEGDTATQLAAAAAHPTAQFLAGFLEAVSGWLLVPAAVGVAARLTGRGRVLGAVAASMAVCTAFAFSALGAMNAYFTGMARELDRTQAIRLYDKVTDSPYLMPFVVLIFVGILGQVLLPWAAFRGGLVRWWIPALATAGAVLETAVSGVEGATAALLGLPVTVAYVLFAGALLRRPAPIASSPETRHPAPEPLLATR
jgi:hypothetical protein